MTFCTVWNPTPHVSSWLILCLTLKYTRGVSLRLTQGAKLRCMRMQKSHISHTLFRRLFLLHTWRGFVNKYCCSLSFPKEFWNISHQYPTHHTYGSEFLQYASMNEMGLKLKVAATKDFKTSKLFTIILKYDWKCHLSLVLIWFFVITLLTMLVPHCSFSIHFCSL